ncbi:hypothetical protein RvY_03720 [Ramazzottius varieornatus]|uniref:PH domain-containing protein n=1 Tax=Ramazzottius varieornatus TaxID=947166 RepID=A0A1D1USI9_RAMVA|nr:hypothetical protein RvY_03720 [Ramazzottius varieornatus]
MSHHRHHMIVPHASSSLYLDEGIVSNEDRRKMTCRSPSSASARSVASSNSTFSSNSTLSSTSSGSAGADWNLSITSREIYKTGKLTSLTEKKTHFWMNERYQEETFWCVFCIHDECWPFLEFYDSHQASLTHQPLKVIPLTACQHISPNISLAPQNGHTFTLTLLTEVHQFRAKDSADMHDWLVTLRNKLHDLQALGDFSNEYSRCPLSSKSDRLLSPDGSALLEVPVEPTGLVVELPPARSFSKSPVPPKPAANRKASPTSGCKRPSPLPAPTHLLLAASAIAPISPGSLPLSSPPACEAPPPPSDMAVPPLPPKGLKPSRGPAAPLPQPSSSIIQATKPPRPPRQIDLLKRNEPCVGAGARTKEAGADLQQMQPRAKEKCQLKGSTVKQELLISFDDESEQEEGGMDVSSYGTLFQRRDQLVPSTPSALPSNIRETRSQAPSPSLSERSVTSTSSEPGISGTRDRQLPTFLSISTPASSAERSLTLRQQQVEKLKQEMLQPEGVRVRIKRTDCLDALALVDCFGCVWVAGWKQDEQPHFHSLFHLGDQIHSVNGISVAKAADVTRLLRDICDRQHAVLGIHRVPRAQVLVITRQFDGQDLGLSREGKSADIRQVVSDGLAAQHGLPTKALSCDGGTLCNWVLTEINHRPLNWFFKDNEIDDRLQAVGKEISILVQPSDLVNAIKKQLRLLRNHKDFIVQ